MELLFRQQFRRELRDGRFVLDFAPSADEALAKVRGAEGATIILIVSDINMPGMSGLDLLPRIKAERPDIPVLMVTAYGDENTRQVALERGADGPACACGARGWVTWLESGDLHDAVDEAVRGG